LRGFENLDFWLVSVGGLIPFWILDFAKSCVGGFPDLSKLFKTDFGLRQALLVSFWAIHLSQSFFNLVLVYVVANYIRPKLFKHPLIFYIIRN
ncbi:hypothetical protein, partial [Nostoc piscinale]|uniref:hypothetical protein n=1 Tax=Nostoc piscinale TaxID=224012 RepID=UPI0039A76675